MIKWPAGMIIMDLIIASATQNTKNLWSYKKGLHCLLNLSTNLHQRV